VIACPVCRATNAERTCRRCKADLGLLFDLEAQKNAGQRIAVEKMLAGDFVGALAEWRKCSASTIHADDRTMR
jgi:hypothetical protein